MFRSRKIWYLLLVILLGGLAIVVKLFFFDSNLSGLAAVRIDSFPKASIFINNREVGQTPFFDEKITAGEYNIRLVPGTQSSETVSPWQTKIKLTAGTLTYISRDIASTEEGSAGQVLMLEPLSSGQLAEIAVISNPNGATVLDNGLTKGKAPIILRDVATGDHEVVVSADGFADQIVRARVVSGYRLNVIIKLGTLSGNTATGSGQLRPSSDLIASLSGQEIARPYVLIKDTSTGFLRVRLEPSIIASEVGQVKPGEKYPLLSETTGWVKIKLANIFGWVSDQYVEKVK